MNEVSLQTLRTVVGEDLRGLALIHRAEPTVALLKALREVDFPDDLGLILRSRQGKDSLAMMKEALSQLPEKIDAKVLNELAADYAAIYLTHQYQASPCESVWLDEDHLERQGPMFEVREWYRRYHVLNRDARHLPDDHLACQLAFIAYLLEQGEPLEEVARFMDEHLLLWIGDFASRVAHRCAVPFFGGIALLTWSYVEELRDLLAEVLDTPRLSLDEMRRRHMSPREPEIMRYVPGIGPGW